MLPGPTLILQCTHCRNLLTQSTMSSGNTFGARCWTDGLMRADMLRKRLSWAKCAYCAAVVATDDLRQVDSFTTYFGGFSSFGANDDEHLAEERAEAERKSQQYADLLPLKAPDAEDLFACLQTCALPVERELSLRLLAWRQGNDRRRFSSEVVPLAPTERQNLARVVELFDALDAHDHLLKGEALRELGLMDRARAVMENVRCSEAEMDAAHFVLALIQAGDVQVRELPAGGPADRRRSRSRILRDALAFGMH